MTDPAHSHVSALMGHSDWVRALAQNLVRDPDAADDLAQEALAIALERPPGQAVNLRGWFSRVLRNLSHEKARRSRWFDKGPVASGAEPVSLATDELVSRAEAQHMVAEEVLALDEPYRATLLLRYFEGLTVRDMAGELNVSVATVTSRLTRAHALLRERLDRRSGSDRSTWMSALVPFLSTRGRLATAASGALSMSLSTKVILVAATLLLGLVVAISVSSTGLDSAGAVAADNPPSKELPEPWSLATQSSPTRFGLAEEETAVATVEAPRVPSLGGHVFQPDGSPAADAMVVLGGTGDLRYFELGEDPPESLIWTQTAADGQFAFYDLPRRTVRLTAGSKSNAPSETTSIELAENESSTELRLNLRVGGRVYGDVIRKDGSLARHRAVRLLKEVTASEPHGIRLMRNIETDDQGRFDARHLCPGAWGLVTFASDEELVELGGTMPEHMVQATVALEDGQEQFIVLGSRSSVSVRVSGHIRSTTGPVAGMMQWIGECADPMGSQVIAQADESGQYEVELPQAGVWYVRVIASIAHTEHYVDLDALLDPQAAGRIDGGLTLDFAIPTGSVTGYVFDEDGNPVSGAQVSHLIHEGLPNRLGLSVGQDFTSSKADGSFEFTAMDPGTYQLGVVHASSGVSEPITVMIEPGGRIEDIEFLIEAGARLEGVVVGEEGAPLRGAPMWIRDAAGHVLNPISGMRSGKNGKFRSPPLPDGDYSILCQVGELVANIDRCRPGVEGSDALELRLEKGASIQVRASLGDDAMRPQVRVTDLDGRLFSGVRNRNDSWEWKRYPFDSTTRWIGPLPPGTYEVHTHVPGHGTRTQKVTLTAGESKEVNLAY